MEKILFIGWLFVTAISCLMLAGMNGSLGWLVGGIVILCVAVYAARQFKKERQEPESKGVSLGFFGISISLMIVAMLFLFWLQFSAS